MKNKIFRKITTTLRGRLSLWYGLSVSLIILSFLVAVGGLFWVTLQDQIDHHLQSAVREAKQIVEAYHGKERDGLMRSLVSGRGMTVVVLSADGAPILETNSSDVALVTEHQLQEILALIKSDKLTPTRFTENNIRFAAMPVEVDAGKGIVAVGYSTEILYATFFKMIGIVMAVIFFLVLPITLISYRLLKSELKPLENITDQAKVITDTASLSKRIIINSSTQELKVIQEAFNAMLAQLENIFTRERQFFSDAAHTLKTPLAVLRSQVENSNLNQKRRMKILKTINKTNETIQDLLFLSRIGSHRSGKLETVSLTEIMNNLSQLVYTLKEDKSLKTSFDIQEGVNLKADRRLLQRALTNIVHNAIIYNRPHGSIKLSLKKSAHQTRIVIRDTGIGIPKKDLQDIGVRFFRGTNVDGQGSGLGLAISKAVIESLGGTMTIVSVLNKGTIVSIVFS